MLTRALYNFEEFYGESLAREIGSLSHRRVGHTLLDKVFTVWKFVDPIYQPSFDDLLIDATITSRARIIELSVAHVRK